MTLRGSYFSQRTRKKASTLPRGGFLSKYSGK